MKMPTRAPAFGFAYFAIVFIAGIVLGTIRVALLAPNLGPLVSVMIELPFILTICWFVAGFLLRALPLSPAANEDILAGAIALVLLIAAEAGLAVALAGTSLPAFLIRMLTPEGLIGLAGQLVFAAIPAIRVRQAS